MIGFLVQGFVMDLKGFRGRLVDMSLQKDGMWHVIVEVKDVVRDREILRQLVYVYEDVHMIHCNNYGKYSN